MLMYVGRIGLQNAAFDYVETFSVVSFNICRVHCREFAAKKVTAAVETEAEKAPLRRYATAWTSCLLDATLQCGQAFF